MQFTSIPTWISIDRSVAESHIVWWTSHVTRVSDFPSFATDCNNININNYISIAGSAKVDLLRWKSNSNSAFSFKASAGEWKPDNRKSKWAKGSLEERKVIAEVGSRAIMFDKMGPSNPAEHFSQRLPKYTVWAEAGWENTDLSQGELLFLLPSYQVTISKWLPIYSGISSWVSGSEGLIDESFNKGSWLWREANNKQQ